jgi:hypothetical protein
MKQLLETGKYYNQQWITEKHTNVDSISCVPDELG